MSAHCRLLVVLCALAAHCSPCLATCVFPTFLWKPVKGGTDQARTWITEGRYDAKSDEAGTQLEVTVKASELEARISHESRCSDFKGHHSPCRHWETDHIAKCVHETEDGMYTVEKFDKGRHLFSCIRFVQRNSHIVQLWEATPSEEMDIDALCRDSALKRQVWPWVVPQAVEWTQCPLSLVGGYDMDVFDPFTKEQHCKEVWKQARLEIDCVLGEGILLTFPSSSCSPLRHGRLEITLQCMGHWTEEEYIFLMAAEPNKTAQFVFRFSSAPPALADDPESPPTVVEFYTSPITPLERRGMPLDRSIQHLQLELRRSQSGMCFDESTECIQLAHEGKCNNGALFHANHCKKSCGLCKLQPYSAPECRFKRFEKDWLLFNRNRLDKVSIVSKGSMYVSPQGSSMSSLGEFLCKGTHWELDDYKVLSHYPNGCRPRYTCIRFEDDGPSTVKIQISKSLREDRSFDMCEFEDDPHPLGNVFRSAVPKILWVASETKNGHCGLQGVADVTVRGAMGVDCPGTLSDWDVHSCQNRSKLKLDVTAECPDTSLRILATKEFHCMGYITIDGGYNLLMTRTHEDDKDRYACWVIKTYPERMSHRPWNKAYLLETAQCGNSIGEEDSSRILQSAPVTIRTQSDDVKRYCEYRVVNGNHPTATYKESADQSAVRKQYVRYDDMPGSAHCHRKGFSIGLLLMFSLGYLLNL